jgi:integrase
MKRFARLNRDAIRRLKPGQTISEHGITVTKLGNGDVRYSVNVMVGGQRIHRVVGKASEGTSRTQAEDLITNIKSEARANRLGLPKSGRKLAPTFAVAAQRYIAQLETSGGKDIKVKQAQLRNWLIPAFGTKRLDAIAQLDVERFKRARVVGGAAPASVNRSLAALSHLFSMALEWGWITYIPVRPKKYAEDNGRITVLSDDEIARLLEASIAGRDPDLWLFIEIARNTGMRHGEILRIRWQECDLVNRRIFIPLAKAGSREQPITASLAEILKRERGMREDTEGYIFPARYGRNSTGHLASFKVEFRRAVIRAGLDPKIITPHVLRHTAVTKLVMSGADLMTIMRISGHKTLRMVQRYAHVSAPHIDQAIRALDLT